MQFGQSHQSRDNLENQLQFHFELEVRQTHRMQKCTTGKTSTASQNHRNCNRTQHHRGQSSKDSCKTQSDKVKDLKRKEKRSYTLSVVPAQLMVTSQVEIVTSSFWRESSLSQTLLSSRSRVPWVT